MICTCEYPILDIHGAALGGGHAAKTRSNWTVRARCKERTRQPTTAGHVPVATGFMDKFGQSKPVHERVAGRIRLLTADSDRGQASAAESSIVLPPVG